MGGDLICDIIDRAEWTMDSAYKLILQPMTKSEVLRFWLVNNGYNIEKETYIDCYTILSVRFSGQNSRYNDSEIYVGKNPSKEYFLKQFNYIMKKQNLQFYKTIIEDLKHEYGPKYL